MQATRSEELVQDTDQVLGWRFEELVRAGMDSDHAWLVASETWIDLHEATDLLRRGCPSPLALRILV